MKKPTHKPKGYYKAIVLKMEGGRPVIVGAGRPRLSLFQAARALGIALISQRLSNGKNARVWLK